MKRTGVIISTMLMLAALALPALAGPKDEWPPGGPTPHGHLLVLESGECIELASGQLVPVNAHHLHIHRGAAGGAQTAAGHTIYTTIAYADCAAYEAAQP